jgi:hypothetical protein
MKPFDLTLLTYDLTSDDQLLHDALVRLGTAVRVAPLLIVQRHYSSRQNRYFREAR